MFFLRSCPLLRNGCRGQDRDHAHHSNLWQWPVKELKARLEALGADLKGVTEKTELVNLLEQLQPAPKKEEVPPFELIGIMLITRTCGSGLSRSSRLDRYPGAALLSPAMLVLSEARLEALGADLKGVTEKTELVNLLEQLQPAPKKEEVPPFELIGIMLITRTCGSGQSRSSRLDRYPGAALLSPAMLVLSEARLEALGADLKGVTEKTELVNLLEQQKAALCEFAHGAAALSPASRPRSRGWGLGDAAELLECGQAMPSPPNPEEPFAHLEEDDCHSLKRPRGPLPSPTPEARDHARHSELWDLPVKELKARLRAIGADFTGLAEKTELIMLLERSVELRRKEYLHTENIPTFVL
ncbi:unnamed protein product [Effrenium voratum]|uniref:SAP domain-containing protein n=1 Tax=Effrenium voratum TaxID=2562239 RepID=A0AA36MNL0_9DINO|nr:unnamed protein product [Effrenium voratum]